MFLREYRSPAHLIFQRGQCFDRVKVWGSSGNVTRRHTWCFSKFNDLTQSRFEVLQGMLLTGIFDVSARSMFRYSQSLRFLRECRSPTHLMFQWCQSFDTVNVWGSSGNVARRHTWCFSKFNALTQSKFEIPQRMSLADTLDVSARSMLKHSQSLRFLKECRMPKHLMFQIGQGFDTVKFWGSSGNVACRHTWCFSEVNV